MTHDKRNRTAAPAVGRSTKAALILCAQADALWLAAPLLAAANDCQSILTPIFSVLKQKGDIPPGAYATVTMLSASGNTNNSGSPPDPARYAFGNVVDDVLTRSPGGPFSYFAESLHGTIEMRANTSKTATQDMFAPGALSLKLAVDGNGLVSVQTLLHGNPIGGLPPRILQGTCTSGLFTAVDPSNSPMAGGTVWSISFTTSPPGSLH